MRVSASDRRPLVSNGALLREHGYIMFYGIDVGKSEYNAARLTVDETSPHDNTLPNDKIVYAQFPTVSQREDLC